MDSRSHKEHCEDCFQHARIEEMIKEIKGSEAVIREDLKKNVSLKVFSIVLSVVVTLISTVFYAQFYQTERVHQDLLSAINSNHKVLSGKIMAIEGTITSLAISQAMMDGEIINIGAALTRLDRTSESHEDRVLRLERGCYQPDKK